MPLPWVWVGIGGVQQQQAAARLELVDAQRLAEAVAVARGLHGQRAVQRGRAAAHREPAGRRGAVAHHAVGAALGGRVGEQ